MRNALRNFPLIVIFTLIICAAMAVPMIHAITLQDWDVARTFFYHGAFFAILAIMAGLALANRSWRATQQYQLLSLTLAFAVLPLAMAAPMEHLVPAITFGQAYFEMLSAFTTTGATIFDDPSTIPSSLHLWRALVSWLGGFLVLVAAVAILEPMRLGGFEIEAAFTRDEATQRRSLGGATGENERLLYHAQIVFPPYAVLTVLLAFLLLLFGDPALVALCHAMSVLSTSAITPLASFTDAPSGYLGEVFVFLFLFAALSRRSLRVLQNRPSFPFYKDPEYRFAVTAIAAVTGLLIARHFIAAFEVQEQENVAGAAQALWGSAFNVLSYLSTTGFDSRDWDAARDWSGLSTPGTILLALCLLGGGIATTTGGVKLLRVYSLYKHGVREMQRLIHPNSVGGSGMTARRIRREGASIAWIFLMLFLSGIGVVLLAITALGQDFDTGIAIAIASLTNTGPAAFLLDPDFTYSQLDGAQRGVISAAMIVGRLEVLVFISLLNPEYWRS